MGRQSEIFRKTEGDAWLKRNLTKIDRANDPVLAAMREIQIRPGKVLEIGCADGWRLKMIKDEFGCNTNGIEPGFYGWEGYVERGTADKLSWDAAYFDVVIYGFCLYLCDREDLFKIVAEGDRVLKDGGFLVIWDFEPNFPHMRAYRHHEDVYSYKMNYANLWLANPAYSLFRRNIHLPIDMHLPTYDSNDKTSVTIHDSDDKTSVTILKKNTRAAYPLEAE